MKLKKLLLFIFFALFLTACQTVTTKIDKTTEQEKKELSKWLNKPESDLKIFKDEINPEKYNGATLIGLNGISVKSHGSASPYAFNCAIKKCFDFINNDLNQKIIHNFRNL